MKYSQPSKFEVFFKKEVESNKLLRRGCYWILKIYDFAIGGPLFRISKKYASIHTQILHLTEWGFSDRKPSSYKHEINLYNWRFQPAEVEFLEPVLARMLIKESDLVLDLCCGDGSYAYLFFSDISRRVDAIDYDLSSIQYARKNFATPGINFICSDVLRHDYLQNEYDVVVWGSGVAYFSKSERRVILAKIFDALKPEGFLYIRTPLERIETTSANQKCVILDREDFESEFKGFSVFFFRETYYKNRVNLNYVLKKIPSENEGT